jgi:AraC-like DNA-binding protein
MELGSWAAGSQGSLLITFQKAGRSRILQSGRDVMLSPGDLIIWDLGRRWEVDDSQSAVHLSVKIPSKRLAACLGDVEPCLMLPLRADDVRTQLLGSVIQGVGRLAFGSSAVQQPDAVSDLLLSAARVAFGGDSDGKDCGNRCDSFHREVFRVVDERCHDTSICVAGLAADLGMSLRSFQRIFHQKGTSPSSYILSRRIEMAAEKLRGLPPGSRATVTEVALASGFNDPGYFGRVFLKRFGVTPGEFLRRNRSLS